jgi:hypothetical protein
MELKSIGAYGTLSKGVGFLENLPRDWKITALRTSIYRFFYQMLLPYVSIYTIALGATGTQLGMVNGIGLAPRKFTLPVLACWLFPIFSTVWPRVGLLLSLRCLLIG